MFFFAFFKILVASGIVVVAKDGRIKIGAEGSSICIYLYRSHFYNCSKFCRLLGTTEELFPSDHGTNAIWSCWLRTAIATL